MSYILDALKKSEQERGHGRVPDVQTVHSSGMNYRKAKKAYWPYVLITAVLLNFAAITYFIVNKDNPQTRTPTAVSTGEVIEEDSITPPAPKIAAQPDTTSLSNKEDSNRIAGKKESAADIIPQETEAAEESRPAIIEKQATEKPVANLNNIIDYYDLPESIQKQLPTITVSAHVYSSNPLQRSIVINNNFMEEGEYLIDGLILYEITPDGAIFDYQGTLFRYGVVSGWQ